MSSNNGTNSNTSGESVVRFDAEPKGVDDCVSNKIMAEIVRRLKGFLETGETGDVVTAPEPPTDKTKLWSKTDLSGNPIGELYVYNAETSNWELIALLSDVPSQLARLYNFEVTSADFVNNIAHQLGTNDYFYTVVYKDAPGVDARHFEVNRDTTNLELRFLDLANVNVEVRIITHVEPTSP